MPDEGCAGRPPPLHGAHRAVALRGARGVRAALALQEHARARRLRARRMADRLTRRALADVADDDHVRAPALSVQPCQRRRAGRRDVPGERRPRLARPLQPPFLRDGGLDGHGPLAKRLRHPGREGERGRGWRRGAPVRGVDLGTRGALRRTGAPRLRRGHHQRARSRGRQRGAARGARVPASGGAGTLAGAGLRLLPGESGARRTARGQRGGNVVVAIASEAIPGATPALSARAEELFQEHLDSVHKRADRLFGILMAGQWVFGLVLAIVVSPWAWEGKVKTVHVHVWAALLLGGALSALPIFLVVRQPGATINRYVIAVAQMLWSALLIHLTGGRIETHFHVFGSLAFLAFYRDWRVLIPATIVVATDHLLRGIFWPESVYGILFPEWWRFLEHAFWVVFEDIVLVFACLNGIAELRVVADRRAAAEQLSESNRKKSEELAEAMRELQESQDARL